MRRAALAVLLLVCGMGPTRAAGSPEAGALLVREVRVGGQAHRYAVWRPPGHDAHASWPAIVFLHGSGESGDDPLAPTRVGLGPVLLAHPERWPFVVVFPQKPSEQHEWEEHEDLVRAALGAAVRESRVDPDRVALVGMSQGGHGAWVLGARDSSRWRALVPICGYGRARTIARRVAALPVWAFHGLRDDLVDPRDTRDIVEAVRHARRDRGLDPGEARLTLYPAANHNSWDPAFAEPDLPGWLLAHTARR